MADRYFISYYANNEYLYFCQLVVSSNQSNTSVETSSFGGAVENPGEKSPPKVCLKETVNAALH